MSRTGHLRHADHGWGYAAGSLAKLPKAAMAKRLTDVLVQMEGDADTLGGRGFAWVFFSEFAPDDLWVAGQRTGGSGSAARFVVHVSIPEGYMNRAHKNEVHGWVAAAIIAVTGDQASVLTIIHEVTEGNWGSRGLPISLKSISETVGQPAAGPRMMWSRSYFAAKKRAAAA